MCRVRVFGGLRDWKVANRRRGHGSGRQGRDGGLPHPVGFRFRRLCAMAPFGAPRTMPGLPDMLWRPRRPFGGGLASHPKIQAPHAAAATAVGFPMRPLPSWWLSGAAGSPKGGQAGCWTGSRRRVFGCVDAGWRVRSQRRRISAGCLPVPGGSWGGFRRKACRFHARMSPAGVRDRRRFVASAPRAQARPGLFGTVLRQAATSWPERAYPSPAASSPGCLPVVGKECARFCGLEPIGSGRRRVYRSRYVCGLVVPPTPEHSPDAFLISRSFFDHN